MPKKFALILWDLHGNHHHHRALLVAKKHWQPYFKIFQSTCFQSSLPFLIVLNTLLMLQLMLQPLFRTTVSKHVSIQYCSIYTCMYIYDTYLYTIYIYISIYIYTIYIYTIYIYNIYIYNIYIYNIYIYTIYIYNIYIYREYIRISLKICALCHIQWCIWNWNIYI